MIQANTKKCHEPKCKEQAVAFFPVCDPDIPSYPYCRKCLDKVKLELLMKLTAISNPSKT
jgi:hypothetical protein